MTHICYLRHHLACLALLAAMLVAACAAPSTATPSPDADDEPQAAATPRPAPPTGDPLPAERVASPVDLDFSCGSDADCAVKNVGNCCGAMPACVHKDSPTDPAAVQAECARKGMASVCGFREISACTCDAGRCRAASDAGVVR